MRLECVSKRNVLNLKMKLNSVTNLRELINVQFVTFGI